MTAPQRPHPPVPSEAPDAPGIPEDVRTAWTLWLAAVGFALGGAFLNSITSRYSDLPAATREALTKAAGPAVKSDEMGSIYAIALVFAVILAIALAGLTIWLAYRMRAGKRWARVLLDFISIVLVVEAVMVVVGILTGSAPVTSGSQILGFLVYALQILAGLCAGVAVWRQHGIDAEPHFAKAGAGRER